MAIDIDGYAVLGAIAKFPQAFPALRDEVSKIARLLVVKQLKEKTLAIDSFLSIAEVINHDEFDLILDLMTDAEIKALAGKVDKLNADAKIQTPQWQRKHLSELARSTIEPAAKKPATSKKTASSSAKPKVERAVNSRAMQARKR